MSNKPKTAVTVTPPLTLTSDELTALLQQTGWAERPSGDAPLRMKLDGNMLTTPDGEMFVYNPVKPKVPAMTVRVVSPPEEYWAMFINEANAKAFGDSSLANTFSKSYVIPDANRRIWPSDHAFDDLKEANLYDDYGKALKPSWKGDIRLQIIPDDGQLKGSEPIYTLTLSTTSLIEFKGTGRAPEAGSVSEKNFIRKLSEFAIANAGEVPATTAVLNALTSLTLGGVAAEVRILRGENKELGRSWSVVSFDPVHIEPMQEGDTLLAPGESVDDEASS